MHLPLDMACLKNPQAIFLSFVFPFDCKLLFDYDEYLLIKKSHNMG